MTDMVGWVMDVNGAFLTGEFQKSDPTLFMHVPEGMQKFYPDQGGVKTVLQLLVPIYGTKQAARCYFDKVKLVLGKMGYEGSKADPCLFVKWDKEYGLCMCLTWVDDKLFIAHKDIIQREKDALKSYFKCDDVGELKDYVGCKIEIDRERRSMKISQPVLVQSLTDEFQDIPQGRHVLTPATPGGVLTVGDDDYLNEKEHKRYRTGVGKLANLAKLTRPDVNNAVRDLSRHSHAPTHGHWKQMGHCIRYVRFTPSRGLLLQPNDTWDGKDNGKKFVISGRSDSNYATDPETRKSVTGTRVFLCGSPVMYKSATQKHVTLSVTEAELAAAVDCAQDMMYVYRIVTSLGLQVELPMVCEVDNSGARDFANSWSVGGRMRHIDVKQFFIRELKEAGLMVFRYISGSDNEADILTKNVDAVTLHKHAEKFCGVDNLYETLKGGGNN
jgi:hypothetical protein